MAKNTTASARRLVRALGALGALGSGAAVPCQGTANGPAPVEAQGSRPASRPARSKEAREREAAIIEALQHTVLRMPMGSGEETAPGFDSSGWPNGALGIPVPAHAVRGGAPTSRPVAPPPRQEPDPGEAAFLAIGALALEVEYSASGPAGEVLFRRTLRHEIQTASMEADKVQFPDGRSFARAGDRISAVWGNMDRPDLGEEARGWIDGCGFLLRLPFIGALAREGAGAFAPRGSLIDGPIVEWRFLRGGESLDLRKDARGVTLEARHRPAGALSERRILLSEPIAVGSITIPSVRVVCGPDGKTPSLTVRILRVQQIPSLPGSRPAPAGR